MKAYWYLISMLILSACATESSRSGLKQTGADAAPTMTQELKTQAKCTAVLRKIPRDSKETVVYKELTPSGTLNLKVEKMVANCIQGGLTRPMDISINAQFQTTEQTLLLDFNLGQLAHCFCDFAVQIPGVQVPAAAQAQLNDYTLKFFQHSMPPQFEQYSARIGDLPSFTSGQAGLDGLLDGYTEGLPPQPIEAASMPEGELAEPSEF